MPASACECMCVSTSACECTVLADCLDRSLQQLVELRDVQQVEREEVAVEDGPEDGEGEDQLAEGQGRVKVTEGRDKGE